MVSYTERKLSPLGKQRSPWPTKNRAHESSLWIPILVSLAADKQGPGQRKTEAAWFGAPVPPAVPRDGSGRNVQCCQGLIPSETKACSHLAVDLLGCWSRGPSRKSKASPANPIHPQGAAAACLTSLYVTHKAGPELCRLEAAFGVCESAE